MNQKVSNSKPKRERDPEAKKRRISKAATELFVDKGFYPTTLADIAAKAQVSKSTILLHFRSLENLARELIEYHFKVAGEDLKVPNGYSSVEESIKVGMANYVRWCAANPYPARFLLAVRHLEFLDDLVLPRNIAYETSKSSVERLRQGQQEGFIRPGDPVLFAHMISSPVSKVVQMKLELGIGDDLEKVADELGDLAWRMIRADCVL